MHKNERRPAGAASESIAADLTSVARTCDSVPLNEFVAGYRLGYGTGYDVGHAHGVQDESAAWTAVLTGCAESWRRPRYAEVMAAREITHEPCGSRACGGRCSVCVHAESWARRGNRPYLGQRAELERAR